MQTQGWNGRGRLNEMVAELDRQRKSRVDCVADLRNLAVEVRNEGADTRIVPADVRGREWFGGGGVTLSKTAFRQLCDRIEPSIPAKFADEIVEKRPEVAQHLLTSLTSRTSKRCLIRMLDGKVRAVLSDKYRVLDSYDMAFAALDQARAVNANVLEASVSEHGMYLKLVSQDVFDFMNENAPNAHKWLGNRDLMRRTGFQVKDNVDPRIVRPVVTLRNGETGKGGASVRLGIIADICSNHAIIETLVQEIHLGETLLDGIASMQTQSLAAQTAMSRMVDAVKGAFNRDRFCRIVARCNAANKDEIAQPTQAVQKLTTDMGISDEKRELILEHFLKDYQQTPWGLAQAVSRVAQNEEDAEAANDLEVLAGKIIEKPSLVLA